MRLFARQDVLLIAGLAAALVILFAEPISRVFDVARDIERASGLALLPALLLLAIVFVVHRLRRQQDMIARAEARDAERRAAEIDRVAAFGDALARALDLDAIRAAVTFHLPRIAGTDDLWVLVRHGAEWESLAGGTRHAPKALAREHLAARAIAAPPEDTPPGQSLTLPLVVGGAPIGVLGVTPRDGELAPDRRAAIDAAATLLAVSLKNAQLVREAKRNSLRDPLTGCATRAHALEVVDAELRRARRSHMPVSFIMFDLDHFRDINERYGRLCGDAVLAAVGRRMREVLRGSDVKCRYGGEEFLVLLPETPLSGARRVAETLRREIAERPIPWAGEALAITASLGITQALPGEVSLESIIARADAALYRAKHEGRNCVRIASDDVSIVKGA
jgi:diguanylate cyclase (GGDEF)-like protein